MCNSWENKLLLLFVFNCCIWTAEYLLGLFGFNKARNPVILIICLTCICDLGRGHKQWFPGDEIGS